MDDVLSFVRERHAKLMLTTKRVGDPAEDASMKEARPFLSKINELGIITVDSQMGVKNTKKHTWQRSYVSGFTAPYIAARLKEQFKLVDSVIVLVFPHGEDAPKGHEEFGFKHMPRLTLSIHGPERKESTRLPLGACQPFGEMWLHLLPEFHAELKKGDSAFNYVTKAHCKLKSVQIHIVDMVFGRKLWLFKEVIKRLRASKTSEATKHTA
jgi:hypothetical protein